MGTKIDDATQKVTLVATDKLPLGDGSGLPKYYEVSQISEYATSVLTDQVSVLNAARTSIGQAVSVNTAALVSINSILDNSTPTTAEVSAIVEAYGYSTLTTAQASTLVETYGYASVNYVSATYLTKASSSAFAKPAEVCTLVEAYGYASVNYVSSTYLTKASSSAFAKPAEVCTLVEAYGYASVDYVSATYLTKASSSAFAKPAEVCTLVEAYGFTSTNVVSTMISAAQVVSIYTLNALRALSAGDQNGYIAWTSTGGGIFTIPTCATIPFPIGAQITFRQRGTGKLGVSASPGVSIQTPSSCSSEARGQGSTFTLIKYDSDTWDITGDLSIV